MLPRLPLRHIVQRQMHRVTVQSPVRPPISTYFELPPRLRERELIVRSPVPHPWVRAEHSVAQPISLILVLLPQTADASRLHSGTKVVSHERTGSNTGIPSGRKWIGKSLEGDMPVRQTIRIR